GRLATGQLPHPGDEQHQLARRVEDPVRGRADAGLALRHVPGGGDLRRHLRAGQDPAETRLGTLAQLQLHALDLRVRRLVPELVRVEVAVGGPGAEVAAAELPDQVAAAPEVVLGQAALAGVVR